MAIPNRSSSSYLTGRISEPRESQRNATAACSWSQAEQNNVQAVRSPAGHLATLSQSIFKTAHAHTNTLAHTNMYDYTSTN